jgi:hypothetical protein
LGKDLEISLAKTNSALSQICTLSANIFLPDWVVCFFGCFRRVGEFGFEVGETILSCTNIAEKVEVIV